jgi:hypothetical protein
MVILKALSIDGTFRNIPVTSGEVKIDRTSQDVRRTISFTTNDATLVPTKSTDALSIYGNHIYAYRGVLWNIDNIGTDLANTPPPLSREIMAPSSGAYEIVPLGVFRINSVSIDEQADGQITISVDGSDISSNIAKNAWTSPVTVWKSKYTVPVSASATTPEQTYIATGVHEAIKLLINDRWGNGRKSVFGEPRFEFGGVANKPLTKPVIMGSMTISTTGSNSPWTDITGLAASIGAELFVDADGSFRLQPIPDPNTISPVWDFFDGEGGLLITANRKLNDSKAVNYVIATGENTGTKTPVKAVAYDGDPASPTYYKGEFGRVVGRESGRKKLTTQAEVQNAADTYLNWFVGGEEATTMEGVVNPALDTGDVIRVRRKRIGIYRPESVVTELSADFPIITATTVINKITVTPLKKSYPAGSQMVLYTNNEQEVVVLSHTAPQGSTTISVQPFKPKRQYRKNTIVLDPADASNAGSISHYIDQMTIPLDLETPMNITARVRRVGSRQDAIRVAEYSQGY